MNPPNANSLSRVTALFHRRWSIPVLVELRRHDGEKFITLVHRLRVGRATLRATLDDLIEQGLVRPNAGTGHPMRPEFVLTETGARIAAPSARLLAAARRLDVEALALRKWTVPVLLALGRDERRFTDLRATLAAITPRALTLSLKDLLSARLVHRDVYDAYPPTTVYRIERRARPMLSTLPPLVRGFGLR